MNLCKPLVRYQSLSVYPENAPENSPKTALDCTHEYIVNCVVTATLARLSLRIVGFNNDMVSGAKWHQFGGVYKLGCSSS
jgi:hypothetical protein